MVYVAALGIISTLVSGRGLGRLSALETMIALTGVYVGGLLLAGVVAGALSPLATTRLRMSMVLMIAMAPFGVVTLVAFLGWRLDDWLLWVSTAAASLLVGAIQATIEWRDWRPRDQSGAV